jgi:hypothetical protein
MAVMFHVVYAIFVVLINRQIGGMYYRMALRSNTYEYFKK